MDIFSNDECRQMMANHDREEAKRRDKEANERIDSLEKKLNELLTMVQVLLQRERGKNG